MGKWIWMEGSSFSNMNVIRGRKEVRVRNQSVIWPGDIRWKGRITILGGKRLEA